MPVNCTLFVLTIVLPSNDGSSRRRCVDGHIESTRRRAGHARHRIRRGKAMGAVRQARGRVTPGPAGSGHHAVEKFRAVKDIDRAVRNGAAAQRQRAVVGDVVTCNPAVGRERRDVRSSATSDGAVTVTVKADDAALVLPAASAAVAVKALGPAESAPVV